MNLEEKFTAAESGGQDGAFVRIDDSNPVDLFVGLEGGQRAVMIRCASRPPDAPVLAAISVDARQRADGGWALVLRLQRAELKPLFTRLVDDLDATLRQGHPEPGAAVVARLVRWQRLFTPGTSGVLADHELRGLCAELAFLINEAIPSIGAPAGVAAWVGPFDAPKDFVFDAVEVEVKAAHAQSRHVRVSSLEQLTDMGRPLYLWVLVVELSQPAPGATGTVAQLVAAARDAAAASSAAAEQMDVALAASGYEDRPEYEAISVHFGPSRLFRVAEKFPRLERPHVPSAISACQYDLDLADLGAFRVARWLQGAAP